MEKLSDQNSNPDDFDEFGGKTNEGAPLDETTYEEETEDLLDSDLIDQQILGVKRRIHDLEFLLEKIRSYAQKNEKGEIVNTEDQQIISVREDEIREWEAKLTRLKEQEKKEK